MNGASRRRWTMGGAVGLALLATVSFGATPASAASITTVKDFAAKSLFDTTASKSATASCPSGQRVLGGGAAITGVNVNAVITELQPIHAASGDGFKASGADPSTAPAGWRVTAYAFCSAVPASLGVEIVSHVNPPTSAGTDQARTQCPGGKFLVGAGGRIDNGQGHVDLGLTTGGSGTFVFSSAAFAKKGRDGFDGSYTVTGYSVCAQGAFGDIQQVKSTTATTAPSQTADTACPSGFHVTGLAGNTSAPGTHLGNLTPRQANGLTVGRFIAQSSVPPTGSWQMESTVFCGQ